MKRGVVRCVCMTGVKGNMVSMVVTMIMFIPIFCLDACLPIFL